LAYTLQQPGRALVIGERTAGAGTAAVRALAASRALV